MQTLFCEIFEQYEISLLYRKLLCEKVCKRIRNIYINYCIYINDIFFTLITKFVKITTNEFAKIISIAIFASISIFFTLNAKFAKRISNEFAKFISKSMIAISTFFATFLLTNELILLFESFIIHQKSIFDILFF